MAILAYVSTFLFVSAQWIFGQTTAQATAGNLVFTCKTGWTRRNADCYLPVNLAQSWDDARATCSRQGGKLLYVVNEIEYDREVLDLAPAVEFWTGLKTVDDNNGTWDGIAEHVDLRTLPLWAAGQPNVAAGDEASCVAASTAAGWMTTYCAHRELPFICKYPACIEGHVPCANGEGCVSRSQLCDGVDQCMDKSDERSCSSRCNTYLDIGARTSGSFHTGVMTGGKQCMWLLEAPIGERIRLSIPNVMLEENRQFFEIWTGSSDLDYSVLLVTLTGSVQRIVYSRNNFMIVRLISNDVSSNGFTISWTINIPEIPDGVTPLQATTGWETLDSPVYGQTVPLDLRLYWAITVADGDVITYYVDGTNSLYIRESTDAWWTVATHSQYVATAASELHVKFVSGSDPGARFTMRYIKGCTFSISTTSGMLSSPGFHVAQEFPSDLACVWTLRGGADRNEGQRGMSLTFSTVALGDDPRTPPTSHDLITVSNASEMYNEAITAGTEMVSMDGIFTVTFTSDEAITGRGFDANFYILCEQLELSSATIKSTTDVTYGTDVSLSCPIGYKFNLQEYYNDTTVHVMCLDNGVWSLDRIPECRVVQCGPLPARDNAYLVTSTGTAYTNVSTYDCNEGFVLLGGSSGLTSCGDDGNWEQLPVCQSSSACASRPYVTHGAYNTHAGTDYGYNTILEFTCDEGYETVGPTIFRCVEGGAWMPPGPSPTCKVFRCPLPDIAHAIPFGSNLFVNFGEELPVYCEAGYTASQTSPMFCQSNQIFDVVIECTNKDECDTEDPCGANTECVDSEGSYSCPCLPGFERYDPNSCTDINECSNNNGGCDHSCVNVTGNYNCRCNPGYRLFETDGDQGFSILTASGETGAMPGDKYRLGHTCVPVECPRPVEFENGQLLSSKLTFHYHDYGDTVTYKCNDGYYIDGQTQTTDRMDRTCQDPGWNGANYTCTERSITITEEPMFGSYDNSIYHYGDSVTLTCRYTQAMNVTVVAHVIYQDGNVTFGGPDVTRCPVIDCHDPSEVLPNGAIVVGSQPHSTYHLDDPQFVFGCEVGFYQTGLSASESGGSTVQCTETGRWTLGDLSCLGQTCSDPGTPANAQQIASSYEIGSTLRYECTRPGFTANPQFTYTCNYNQNGDTAEWSNDLARNNLPTCVDTDPPTFTNCPVSYSFHPMDVIWFDYPEADDNVGVKAFTFSDGVQPGDVMPAAGPVTLTFTAEDFAGLSSTCNVSLISAGPSYPNLNCPDVLSLKVNQTAGVTIDISDDVSGYGTLTFSPSSQVSVSLSKLGTQERYDVTAEADTGLQTTCTFMVNFEGTSS